LVVVSLPGAILPGPFPISARTTYGHVSDGMIASAKELGLGDDHDGIVRLVEWGVDAPVGTDAIALLGLDDVACEMNVTPDRGYALSIRGIAREYHHATGAVFRDPAAQITPEIGDGFPVTLSDATPLRGVDGCQVFIARNVRGIDMSKPTPPHMVARLALSGIRSISLPVDITNYVMLELGQPIHAYDLDRLQGGITVRRAHQGERLVTLDGHNRTLHGEDLLITDDSGPIGLAGVMGGERTEISDVTKNVLIEAAWFEPVSIARTQRRHKLPSEASKRFARGVDPRVAEAAAERVVTLLERYAGGVRDERGSRVITPGAGVMPTIHVPEGATEALVGIVVSSEETTRILEDIGARVERSGTALLVTPPSWRPDLVDVPGIVEEVARIVGYDTIPSSLPQAPAGRGLTREQAAKRRTMAALAASGMTEVLSYPFVTEADNVLFAKSLDMRDMALHNAIDTQINRMRVSLLPGLIEVAKRNMSRGFTSLALYEAGLVFDATGQETGTADIPPGGVRPSPAQLNTLYSSTPPQPWSVAGMFVGSARHAAPGQGPVPSDVRDALDAAHIVARALGGSFSLRQATHSAFHPGRCAELLIGDVVVGVVGELLPSLAFERDMPRRVSVFEIDGDAALALIGSAVPVAFALSAFPAATQDVSLVVDEGIPAGDIQATLAEGAGELLEGIALVDDYRGDGVEPGHRSLTFALRFRAADKTLTALEATEAKDRGVALAAVRHGAALRA
jgi:phenylalanyl-tRNA synthetase beta chain